MSTQLGSGARDLEAALAGAVRVQRVGKEHHEQGVVVVGVVHEVVREASRQAARVVRPAVDRLAWVKIRWQ